MSFILESLKQAQRERKSDKGLDLNSVYTDSDSPRRGPRLWFWISILLAITLVVLIVAFWLVAPAWMTDAPGESAGTSEPASLSTGSGLPGELVAKAPPPPSDKRNKKTRNTARPLSLEASVSKPASKTGAAGKGSGTNLPPGSTDVNDGSGLENDDGDFEAITTANNETEPPPTEPSPGAERPIPLFENLPPEIRDRLGPLEINIHAWSRDPSKSLVVVNMRRYRVGDRIGGDGPLVESITPKGVIIDHGDGRALLLAK